MERLIKSFIMYLDMNVEASFYTLEKNQNHNILILTWIILIVRIIAWTFHWLHSGTDM